ncbi:class I SAM-dependent methyltransferase [Thermomonas sp. S9]|jgi:SAM-dependent methyltransferase|uniref:class I SAM-dependent methyltransferase n=1 Tax=Thermomonas sp. S9 TaxID=2885203 RepID=UPI001AC4D833|nr:class I SAM-dependent methyltransferase [Thermomonas sp. S9]MBN8716788.1 class I SAM-dependent methyltransferase [Xanthomonadales bacterium]MCR6496724.1 class I SAM-dependent methyltransferase [Thermomonas sp. S9]
MPFMLPARQPNAAGADAWYATPAGLALLASEAAVVGDALRQRPGQAALWLAPPAVDLLDVEGGALALRLRCRGSGFDGALRCGLPLPLASEACAVVVVQHVLDAKPADAALPLLEECARVLVPGGWLWLFALNPLSPYRWQWRGQGLAAREPIGWRRRLRAAGLAPDVVTLGLGPVWAVAAAAGEQEGAGLRAGYLLRAEKRVRALTPLRRRRALRWQAEPSA